MRATKGGLDRQTNSGLTDAFISKFDSDGSKKWTQLLGTNESDVAWSVSTADDGSVYVGGVTYGDLDGQTNNGFVDAFISKFNSGGTPVGGDENNILIVEGAYSGTLDGVPFYDVREIGLGGGIDSATIRANGYMDSIDAGEGGGNLDFTSQGSYNGIYSIIGDTI